MSEDIEKFFLDRGCLIEEKAIAEIEKRGGIEYIRKNEKKIDFSSPIFALSDLPTVNEFSIVKEFHLDGYPGISESFVDIFRNRYQFLHSKLNERSKNHFFSPISKVKRDNGVVFASGMVAEYSESKKGYGILEIEDETSSIKVILPKTYKDVIIKDEVIGVSGQFSRDGTAIFAENVYRPEVSKEPSLNGSSVKVMVVSDIHVGSKNFIEDSFLNMIDYVNTQGVSFVVMNGDLVDGIGVYPDQESDLAINDINLQYRKFAGLISRFNSNVRVIVIPGNHDIVYPTEPQNPLPKEINAMFPPNVTSLSNPVWVEIGGRIFLLYHGTSIFDFLEAIPGMTLNDTDKVMVEMLKRGHLAPEYGKNLSFIPLKSDYYLIDPVPDVLVTGHVHSHSITTHKGILAINASTFQEQTNYQRMMNFNPKPAIGTLVDTYDLSATAVKF
ncbi:MAG: metallophosphoesterase [Candidatus Thermoplasmatota archaeon]|nr:metallophosphoesterase [Candidatus Thermoplasmatota archaeon]MCL6002663.1 metallophosphoesterase [Candidatus Thermoplasmatota archaeon]